MNPAEAIHNLQLHLDGDLTLYDIKLRQSMHLSIEALSYYQILRNKGIVIPSYFLPGETEE